MTMTMPFWRRWLLLVSLFLLGIGYIVAFVFFRANSDDFVEKQRNAPAADHSALHRLALGDQLRFGSKTAGIHHLGSGWNTPETSGVWSSRDKAWLFLAIAPTSRDIGIKLDADVYVVDDAVDVRLFANDIELAHWHADDGNERLDGIIRLPDNIDDGSTIAFRFEIDESASPWRERRGDDMRMLGIQLRSLRIVPIE